MRLYLIVLLGLLFSNSASAYDMVAYNNGVEVTLTNLECPSGSNGGTIKVAYVKDVDKPTGATCFVMKGTMVGLILPGTGDILYVPGSYFHRK